MRQARKQTPATLLTWRELRFVFIFCHRAGRSFSDGWDRTLCRGLLVGKLGVGLAHLALRSLLHLVPALGLGDTEQVALGLMALVQDAEKIIPQVHVDALGRVGVVIGSHLLFAADKIGHSLLIVHG